MVAARTPATCSSFSPAATALARSTFTCTTFWLAARLVATSLVPGTPPMASTMASLAQSGGTLGGTGVVTVAGSSSWLAGPQSGSGTTRYDGALSLSGAGAKLLATGRTVELLVATGLSPLVVSLGMVAGVFLARFTLPALLKGTDYIVADVREKVWPMIESGQVRTIVHDRVPLAEASRAHAMLEAGGVRGKILLVR